jgi:UDP-N-acetyl-alpha-D-muramoyl-L-alanyl-L-glutamate epimerase
VDTASGPAVSARGRLFQYVRFEVEPDERRLVCHYAVDGRPFREEIRFPNGGSWSDPAVGEAARIVFLLAGISYYKTSAPPVIDLGGHRLSVAEHEFLLSYYLDGLGEFAYRNNLDLSGLRIVAPEPERHDPTGYAAPKGRPLVPFGGGMDSITTVDLVTSRTDDAALFIVNRPADRFAAIERPALVTGLPVVRAERMLDDQVLRSAELGFLNGHVPVTGILSAIAVMAAILDRRDAVVMSNEWSSSVATIELDGRSINHQYSKSLAFETGLRTVISGAIGEGLDYFSALRPFSELWIARRFAGLTQYFDTFRSCNRAFHIDRAMRSNEWCGRCDKCCFIDLILAPFLDRATLSSVFHGREPLDAPELTDRFRILTGLSSHAKPWECVGDAAECQAAALLAAARPDRSGNRTLGALVQEMEQRGADPPLDELLHPIGSHHIPRRYAADALLV